MVHLTGGYYIYNIFMQANEPVTWYLEYSLTDNASNFDADTDINVALFCDIYDIAD